MDRGVVDGPIISVEDLSIAEAIKAAATPHAVWYKVIIDGSELKTHITTADAVIDALTWGDDMPETAH
jgi:hypothetical protein